MTGTSIVMQIRGGGQFRKRISAPTPGTKILVMPQLSYMPDQTLGKHEKPQFLGQILSQHIRTYPKIFQWPNVLCYRLGIAKLLLKNLHLFRSYLEKMTTLNPSRVNPYRCLCKY